MSATTAPVRPAQLPAGPLGFARDTLLLTGRSLRAIPRDARMALMSSRLMAVVPQALAFAG